MNYNLTVKQKALLSWLVKEVREGRLQESFSISQVGSEQGIIGSGGVDTNKLLVELASAQVEALKAANVLLISNREQKAGTLVVHYRDFVLTERAFQAVDTNFANTSSPSVLSELAHPPPIEIAMPLERLRTKFPDPKKMGFLIMRFTDAKPFDEIAETIQKCAAEHGLEIIRADEHEFHTDLWGNVRTYLHGCGFGVAVYERIETDEPNANIGLEVGYLMAMGKPVLLLKDRTVRTLQTDLAGKLYKEFDPHDAAGSIPTVLTKWLQDNGVITSKEGSE